MTEMKTLIEKENKFGATSMRLRPLEQMMFDELAARYGFFGATNTVRAAGRVLAVLGLDRDDLMKLLLQYEREHPEEEPIRFVADEANRNPDKKESI